MSLDLNVRLWAECTVRIPVVTTIYLDELKEWVEESGAVFDPSDIDGDEIVELIKASPDTEFEMNSKFPEPNVWEHEIMTFEIEEAEVLAHSEDGNE